MNCRSSAIYLVLHNNLSCGALQTCRDTNINVNININSNSNINTLFSAPGSI